MAGIISRRAIAERIVGLVRPAYRALGLSPQADDRVRRAARRIGLLPALPPHDSYATPIEEHGLRYEDLKSYADQVLATSVARRGIDLEYVPKIVGEAPLQPAPISVVAFYLPQFHPIPENDTWWGKGFTEWTNVSKAVPQFLGHYQPHLPGELGFYDLRLVDVMHAQASLAKAYGIAAFCFHYYWFSGRRLLERPLEQFLADPTLDISFCLCWANENWTRRWDGAEHEVLLEQRHTPRDDAKFIDDIALALRDKRYLKFEGRPILIVYRVSLLPDPLATAKRWRQRCAELGLPNPYLVVARSFEIKDPRPFGFDAAVEFPPHQIQASRINERVTVVNPGYSGSVYEYADLAAGYSEQDEEEYPLLKTVMPGWDNEARRPGAGNVFHGATPYTYAQWLDKAYTTAVTKRRGNTDYPPYLFVNAWNEWAEGAHLEPDRKFGYGYLQATANVLRNHTQATADAQALVNASQLEFKKRASNALVVHFHFEDLYRELVDAAKRASDMDVFISVRPTISEDALAKMRRDLPNAWIEMFPNRGRDILPFLTVLGRMVDLNYDLICKVHTKKSMQRGDGDQLRAKALASLLPDPEGMAAIKERFRQDPKLGILAPPGSVLNLGSGDRYVMNARWLEALATRRSERPLGDFTFPAGSMYWARVRAIQELTELGLKDSDFELEVGQYDGTLAHALERYVGYLVDRDGFTIGVT